MLSPFHIKKDHSRKTCAVEYEESGLLFPGKIVAPFSSHLFVFEAG